MGGIPGLARENINLGNKYVDDYRADFFLNGTLNEQFRYKMDGSYLNRIYSPLDLSPVLLGLDRPYVETSGFVPIPGTLSYARNWQGDLLVMDEDGTMVAFPDEFRYTRVVNSLAEWDKAGCYNPSYFDVAERRLDTSSRFIRPWNRMCIMFTGIFCWQTRICLMRIRPSECMIPGRFGASFSPNLKWPLENRRYLGDDRVLSPG